MDDTCMNIGGAALKSGVSAKMIRHYEEIGLIPTAQRTDSGYRRYTGDEVHTLVFVKQARNLGFSTAQIADLLGLWRNRRRSSREVKALALAHIAELDERIGELEAMKRALMGLAVRCHGDHRPGCPILDGLAAPAAIADSAAKHRPQVLAPMRKPRSRRADQTN